jgi:hypothetical protein
MQSRPSKVPGVRAPHLNSDSDPEEGSGVPRRRRVGGRLRRGGAGAIGAWQRLAAGGGIGHGGHGQDASAAVGGGGRAGVPKRGILLRLRLLLLLRGLLLLELLLPLLCRRPWRELLAPRRRQRAAAATTVAPADI